MKPRFIDFNMQKKETAEFMIILQNCKTDSKKKIAGDHKLSRTINVEVSSESIKKELCIITPVQKKSLGLFSVIQPSKKNF